MEKIKLMPGDVFGTTNPMALGRMINAVEAFVSRDGQSEFSHSGIIIDSSGATLEALLKVRVSSLFGAYTGQKTIIARWIGMPDDNIPGMSNSLFIPAYDRLYKQHANQIYPGWRLFLHVIPPLAKYISLKGIWVVCSELVAKFLYLVHLILDCPTCKEGYMWPRHQFFTGTNPDMLADEWTRWKGFQVIYKGELQPELFDLEQG